MCTALIDNAYLSVSRQLKVQKTRPVFTREVDKCLPAHKSYCQIQSDMYASPDTKFLNEINKFFVLRTR